MNDSTDTPAGDAGLALLDSTQARILGCLIEKHATTPDIYPLTLNAVVAACNQKSNREPVMDLEPGAVGHALRQLEGRGLVSGSLSARTSRYAHRFDQGYGVTPRQRALLSLLMLRGPQTLNELFTRSERLTDFPDMEEVATVLERLANRSPALVVRLERNPGQREDRYMHLFGGPVSAADFQHSEDVSSARAGSLSERVERLEAELAQLREDFAQLQQTPAATTESAGTNGEG